ncbi:hypothetical protein M2305_003110 [Gluconobacter cerinus]|nr:hypothetical protein [Gluconobacter cerinus]
MSFFALSSNLSRLTLKATFKLWDVTALMLHGPAPAMP